MSQPILQKDTTGDKRFSTPMALSLNADDVNILFIDTDTPLHKRYNRKNMLNILFVHVPK